MGTALRVVIVTDLADDARRMAQELRGGGFDPDWRLVDSEDVYRQALLAGCDLILADDDFEQFGVMAALTLAVELAPHTPFIIVADAFNERRAADAVQRGADEYLTKDRLVRLGSAVTAARRRRQQLAQLQQDQASQRPLEQHYDILDRTSPVGIIHADPKGNWLSANQRWCQWAGLQAEKSLGMGWLRAVHPDDRANVKRQWQLAIGAALPLHCEFRLNNPGRQQWVLAQAEPQYSAAGHITGYIGAITDISKRIELENERRQLLGELNERIEQLTTLHQVAVWLQSHAAHPQELLEHIATLLPASWQDGSAVSARLEYGQARCTTAHFRSAGIAQVVRFQCADGNSGCIELFYHQAADHRGVRHEPAPPRYLIDSLAELLRSHFNRLHAERQLSESESRFRTLMLNLPGAVYRCAADDNWSMHYLSDAVKDLTGYPAGDFIGNASVSFTHLIDPADDANNRQRVEQAIAAREPFELEYRLRHADGDIRWIYEKGQPVFDGNGELLWLDGALFDITQQRRSRELEHDRNHLRTALRAHESVLGVVGHELRTPLAAARAMAEMLIADQVDDPAQRIEYLRLIYEQTVRMATLVNNLLEVARLSSGTTRWQWATVALGPICQSAVARAQGLVAGKPVQLALDLPDAGIAMCGDAEALRRLLDNLLDNACRVTAEGEIRLRAVESGTDTVQLTVYDTGPGMSAAATLHAGEAFMFNAGAIGDRHSAGAGLGLAICKGIVAAHGGRITVNSTAGEGTAITVTLPTRQPGPITGNIAIAEVQTTAGE